MAGLTDSEINALESAHSGAAGLTDEQMASLESSHAAPNPSEGLTDEQMSAMSEESPGVGERVIRGAFPVASAAYDQAQKRGINPVKMLMDKVIEPGVYDSIVAAHQNIQKLHEKYKDEPMGEMALDMQDQANQGLQKIPDLAFGNPEVLKKYAGANDSLIPDIKATSKGIWDYEFNQTHGAIGKLSMPLTIPEQFATRESINGLVALGKMPMEDAKQLLSQDQIFPSDLVNYYWKDPKNLVQRGTRWMLGMGMNILLDPLQPIQGLAKVGAQQKQLQILDKVQDFSKVSQGEFVQAKVASNVSSIITANKDFMTPENMHAVENLASGKVGFGDMAKSMNLPEDIMGQVKNEGRLLGEKTPLIDQVASGERGPIMALKFPFLGTAFEYEPFWAKGTPYLGKAASYLMEYAGKAEAAVSDKVQDYLGNLWNRGASGAIDKVPPPTKLALAAVNQFRTKTGYPVFDSVLNQINGLRSESSSLEQKVSMKGSLFNGASPEHLANVVNILEMENKDPALAENPLIMTGNQRAGALRSSFPQEVSDNLNSYVDFHDNMRNQLLKFGDKVSLETHILDPLKPQDLAARNYVPHVVSKDFLRRNDMFVKSIEGGMEVLKAKGAVVDRSQLGRQIPEIISKVNAVTEQAMGMPMFVNNPAELLQHQIRSTYQRAVQQIIAKSALDHSVVYSASDEANAFRLNHQYEEASKLAALGDEDAIESLRTVGPAHDEAMQKITAGVTDDHVQLDPDHFKELVYETDDKGQLLKDPETGLLRTSKRALTHLPEEFFNGSVIKMPSQIYSRLLEEVNPYRNVGAAEKILDAAGSINSNIKSVFTTTPRFWGMMGLSKALRYIQSGPVNPVRGIVGAARMFEPPLPLSNMINEFRDAEQFSEEAVKAEPSIFKFPDGIELNKQGLHEEMMANNVRDSGMLTPTKWGNVLDSVAGMSEQNSKMGVVPKTLLEIGTLWRTGRYAVDQIDNFWKTAWYLDRRYSGYSPAAAADDTERIFYNFANSSNAGSLKKVSNAAMLFVNHPVKELEYQLHTLTQGPIAQLTVPAKVQHTLEGQYIQDPNVRESIARQMPLYWRLKDLALGPMAPGQNQLAMEIPWSNATTSFFLDPSKNLNPLFSTISSIASVFSRDKFEGDSSGGSFLKGVKDEMHNYWPAPVKAVLSVAEANGYLGDTENIFGPGGLFGNIPQTPTSEGQAIRFSNQLEFGKWAESQLGNKWPYDMLFSPLDINTELGIEQQRLISRGNIVRQHVGDLTGSLGTVIPMSTNEYHVDKNLGERAKGVEKDLIHTNNHLQDLEDMALTQRWNAIRDGTQKIEPMDRTFLVHMGAMQRQYNDLSDQMKKEIADRGLMPDSTAVEDFHKLSEIAKTNPMAAKMISIYQEQQALHNFYSWWVNVNQEAQEKTGIPGFDPIKLIFGLEKIDLSPEQETELKGMQDMSPQLNRSQNEQQILKDRNKETLQ